MFYLSFDNQLNRFSISLPSISQCLSFLLRPGCERGTWSLVCDTEEQWASLAESIKDKTSPQDRHLYRVISENFLPEISSMIEHKVGTQRLLLVPITRFYNILP